MAHHTKQQSDSELVVRALVNKDAYALLVARYHDPLLRYIRRLGCTEYNDAQDVLQSVFIKTYYHLSEYNSTLPFSSWIYRIAHNETISFFRKNKRKPLSFDLIDESMYEAVSSEDEYPERAFDARLNAARLRKVLARLDDKYREVLILHYLEEKTYEEISDILQKPMGTVSVLIKRAKERLRSLLVV